MQDGFQEVGHGDLHTVSIDSHPETEGALALQDKLQAGFARASDLGRGRL